MRFVPLVLVLVVGLFAPLVFPAVVAVVLVAGSALVFPPVALFAGVLTDAVYTTAFVSLPYASLLGLFFMASSYAVHWFVRTRIMG